MSNLPADNRERKLSGTPFMVPRQNMESIVPSVNTGSYLSQPQSMVFPQMLDQSMPLSVFQAPSTRDYYHQAPVSWCAVPTDELMQFPILPTMYTHYTGLPGYSLNGESPLCMQYGTPLNHSATPFFNCGTVPVFHPFADTNTMNCVDQANTLEPLEHSFLKEADENQMPQIDTPSSRGPQTDSDENFSFFHSGGPAALGDFWLQQFSGDHVFGDPTGNSKKEKESTVGSPVGEEYTLFPTSNKLRFNIF